MCFICMDGDAKAYTAALHTPRRPECGGSRTTIMLTLNTRHWTGHSKLDRVDQCDAMRNRYSTRGRRRCGGLAARTTIVLQLSEVVKQPNPCGTQDATLSGGCFWPTAV